MPQDFEYIGSGIHEFWKFMNEAPREFTAISAEVLNAHAFGTRKLAIREIFKQMTIRNPGFVRSRIRVVRASMFAPFSLQQSEVGSVETERFSGWAEQETGQKSEMKRSPTLAARRKDKKKRISSLLRMHKGKIFKSPLDAKGGTDAQRAISLLFWMSRRRREAFVVFGHPRIKSGFYAFKGRAKPGERKLELIQDFERLQAKVNPWMKAARDEYIRRVDIEKVWRRATKKVFSRKIFQ